MHVPATVGEAREMLARWEARPVEVAECVACGAPWFAHFYSTGGVLALSSATPMCSTRPLLTVEYDDGGDE